jgi:hypothetical protein
MKSIRRWVCPTAFVLGVWLLAGCGPSTTNEEGFVPSKDPDRTGHPQFSSYGEYQKHVLDEAREKAAQRKGGRSARKAPSPTPPSAAAPVKERGNP